LEDEKNTPPLRIVAPGKVFRYERVDASHGHTFYQMEGMMIDREVTVGHLIYFMRTLLREIFGFDPKIRLRPGYFPFVEPGFELDIWFNEKWMELLPCGLIHPKVLEHGGIDPDKWQGFAFGLGLSRLVMSRYKINDIRHLQSSDLRFLRQFS
jgi:phenylalanyl-tRNA synthetase alpha chain